MWHKLVQHRLVLRKAHSAPRFMKNKINLFIYTIDDRVSWKKSKSILKEQTARKLWAALEDDKYSKNIDIFSF